MTMLYAGLRRGEVLALRSDDIDLEHNQISVHESVQFRGNRARVKSTKTKAGVRTVPLFSVLRPELDTIRGYVAKSRPRIKKDIGEQPMT